MADVRVASGRFKPLEHHRARRARGTVTVTVLLGNEDAAEWVWRRFHAQADRATVVSDRVERTELLEEWLGWERAWERVEQWVREQAAAREGVTVAELLARARAGSPRQREALANAIGLALDCSTTIAHAALFGGSQPLGALARAFPDGLRLLERVGGSGLPGLLVRRPERGGADWHVAAARAVVEIAEHAPWLDVGLVVSEQGWNTIERALPDRHRTMLAEGLTCVVPSATERASPNDSTPLHARRDGGGAPSGRTPPSNTDRRPHLLRDGRASSGARSQRATPSTTTEQPLTTEPKHPTTAEPPRPQPDAPTTEEFARSQAELRLYRALQARPRTRDLFTLNRKLALRFGRGTAEVDLSCEALGIAVEVDGYRHFQDAAAYRRDRHKDLLLQEAGYWVVRVLASDVTSELDNVLALIDRAIEHRRGKIE
nr:MAG: hypothetical protein DIU78_14975 [Pseudomonadota bacterium]